MHVLEETDPADGSGRLERFLLTGMRVESRGDALRVPGLYGLRWRVEDWHRILKPGCRAERLNLRSAERPGRAVTVKAVIAWRLAAMVMTGRETPELPADARSSPPDAGPSRTGTAEPDSNAGRAVRHARGHAQGGKNRRQDTEPSQEQPDPMPDGHPARHQSRRIRSWRQRTPSWPAGKKFAVLDEIILAKGHNRIFYH